MGYSGNLNSNLFDFNPVEEVIIKYPDLKFYFIGPFNNQSDVYNKLKQYPNCYFIGKLDELPLIKKLNEMDLLIYNYKPDNKIYYADNSHKILEYLSTGKIILGSNLLAYQNSDLVIQANNNKEWEYYFDEIILNTHKFTDEFQFKKRIEFAIANSYQNQLEKISRYIYQNKLL